MCPVIPFEIPAQKNTLKCKETTHITSHHLLHPRQKTSSKARPHVVSVNKIYPNVDNLRLSIIADFCKRFATK